MKTTRSLSFLFALICGARCHDATAANFVTKASQGSGLNWTATIWSNAPSGTGEAPVAGNTYELVDNGTAFGATATGGNTANTKIRNPATAGVQTFPGDSLTMNTNTEIRAKTAGAILNFPGVGGGPGLILNGGVLNAGDNTTFAITGKVVVTAPSFIVPSDNGAGAVLQNRAFDFVGELSGTAPLIIAQAGTNIPQQASGNGSAFSGGWIVKAGWLRGNGPGSLGSGNFLVDPNFALAFSGGSTLSNGPAQVEFNYDIATPGTLSLSNGGKIILHQDVRFARVFVDGAPIANGTYPYAVAVGAFPNNVAAGGSGSISIGPATPTSLQSSLGDSVVILNWNGNGASAGHVIKRAVVAGGPYTPIATNGTSITFVDTDVVIGTPYYYVVSAINDGGESANSNEATGTPVKFRTIAWVSDNPSALGWTGRVSGTADDVFTTNILAGYNVVRFSSDNSQNVLLTQADIDALNTNDLIILGRSLGSGAFQAPAGHQWNTNITQPIIVQSSFLVRNSRLGWFVGEGSVNGIPGPLKVSDTTDPEAAFLFNLFGTVAMNGDTTVDNYDEPLDANTSQTGDAPVAGGKILATSRGTNNVIVEFPAGTAVKGGANILAGYRMFFASGSRENDGQIPSAGKDNLTPTGETIFLRAVQLAIHNGTAPNLGEAPVITLQPSSTNACTGLPITLSTAAEGENPLYYQWYFSDGATFTNALPSGTNSVFTIDSLQTSDAGFYVALVTNAVGAATSSVATVTIAGAGTVATGPADETICPGTPVTFTTAATGLGTLTYTWRRGSTVLQGPNVQNSFTIASVTPADAGGYSVTVTGDCNSVSNNFTLSVIAAPTIATQPQDQTTPMGNGAIFSVTGSGLGLAYQWLSNGVDVAGATGSSLAVSNVSLANNGDAYSVIVSNCAGSITSAGAFLNVTPVSGISFDFDTLGQFTNNPAENVFNDWLFTAQGSFITGFPGNQFSTVTYEVPAGGVNDSGALDIAFHANNNVENTITLLPQLFDFSLPGKTLIASTMFKVKAPTSNGRHTQIGFVTSTNFGIADNTPQGFMTVILEATAQPALTYQLRLQHRRTDGGLTEVTPSATTANLTAGNWYKVKATFANITDVAANTIAIAAELQDMGPNGNTPGAVVLSYAPTNIVNTSLVLQKHMMLAIRGFENRGLDFRDNIYAHTKAGPVVMAVQPASQTVQQGRSATFRAHADGDGPYTYQWNKNGSPITGARNWKYITPPTATADNGAQYTVTVTGPANSVTSDAATLTVQAEALNVVSVGSVDGCVVGVRFDQAVDPATAENPANYLINGVAATSAEVYRSSFGVQGRDGVYVLLKPASVLSGAFTVTVQNVRDVSGNAIASPNNMGAGAVEGLTGVDIDPAQARVLGVNYSFAPGQFEVIGGGHDIFGTSDSLRYLYEQKTGDFDIKVRLTDHWTTRAPAKAGLEVRESLAPNSPQVLLYPNPRRPARNNIQGTTRPAFGAATVAWGPDVTMDNAGYPNAWVRLRRSGDVFIRYSSFDGVNWQFDAQLTQRMSETVYVGLGVCANVGLNNPMFPHAANFEQYGDFAGYGSATIAITQQPTNVTLAAGSSTTLAVAATLTGGPGQGELTYSFQRSNSVSGWVNLPGSGGTNNTTSTGPLYFPDSGAQYRVVIKAPGAAAVTSAVARVTVTDTAVPTISATAIPIGSAGQITVTFSEPVSAATALNPANYVVTNSAGTVFAIAGISFFGDARTVIITLNDVITTDTYGVRVSGVQDLNGNTLATVVRTFAQTLTPPISGPVVVETIGAGIAGGATANLDAYLAHARFTGHQPDFVTYSNIFAHQLSFADSGFQNYGARVFSLFVAPSNGLYKIWLRSDDAARVFMNTNGPDRAGQVLVGENTGANGTYTLKQQGISLTNGQAYFLEAVVKEGGGGDGVSVAIRAQGDGGTPGGGEAIPASQLRFPAADAFPSTPVIAELYTGLSGAVIADQLAAYNSANFVAGVPTYVNYQPEFGAVRDLANSGLDNYLGRLVAHFVPPSTGLYRFWIRSDDSCQFYMNTNAANSTDPAGKVLLGQLNNFINVNYQPAAENVFLVGGQAYFMEGLWKEGGGGDGMTVTFRDQADGSTPPPTEVIPASMLRFPADQSRFGAISLAGISPAAPTVTAGEALTLIPMGLKGALPTSIVWLRDGVVVAQNTTSYTTPRLTLSDNGGVYTLILSNAFSRAESAVTVTVNGDTVSPVLLSAVASQYGDGVTLTFSEALDEETATCAVNYSINGLNILSVVRDITGGNRVFLRTTPHVAGTTYTVTVNDVRDASGANVIADDSTADFAAWAPGGCGVLVEIFTGITGGNEIGRLTGHYKYINNLPDERGYIPGMAFGTTPQAGIPVFNFRPAVNLDNYGARLTSYFIAPSNGLYRFYIRGDDATQLYMNPDGADPGGRMLIARNDGANSGAYDNGTGGSASPVLSLVAGQAYYTEALMKEGGGGDYVTVAWRPIDPVTFAAIPSIPPNTESISQSFLRTIGNARITGTPPATLTVGQNDLVDLRLTTIVDPPSIVLASCYQWQKFDSVGMTFTNIPGATNGNLTFFAALADSGQFRLQATIPGLGDLSYVTLLTVIADTTDPFIVSVNSLDGTTVGVCFNEPINPDAAGESGNYFFNGDLNFHPLSAVVRANDPRTVLLTMPPGTPVSNTFILSAVFISDLATIPNTANSRGTGSVQNLVPFDVGAPAQPGSSFTCTNGEIEVVAGGADIWGASDQGHLTIGPRSGDFDVHVRVASLTRPDAISKAGLMVRETADANSRTIYHSVNPPGLIGGRDQGEVGVRAATGGGTAAFAGSPAYAPVGIPNGWLRAKRVGDVFTFFRSTNGIDWVQVASGAMALPNTVQVGLATTAHNNAAPATSALYRDVYIPDGPTITVQPSPPSQTVTVGSTVNYTVTATFPPNSGTPTYRWRHDGVIIASATGATLSIANAQTSASGTYTVEVGNDGGSVVSVPVTLTVSGSLPAFTAGSATYNGTAGTFSASIQTVNSVTYVVEYKDNLNTAAWTTLTTIVGDGTVKPFTDSGPLPPMRFYQVRVQ